MSTYPAPAQFQGPQSVDEQAARENAERIAELVQQTLNDPNPVTRATAWLEIEARAAELETTAAKCCSYWVKGGRS